MNKYHLSLFLTVLFFLSQIYAQQNPNRVMVSVENDWWISTENYSVTFKANIYLNDVLVPASNDYYYEWHLYGSHNNYWSISTGYGMDEATKETQPGSYLSGYVIVSSTAFDTLTSETSYPYMIEGNGVSVTFMAFSETGTNLYNYVISRHWQYTIEQWKNFNGFLTRDTNEAIESSPGYISSLNKKHQYWNDNTSDILNFNTFYILNGNNDLNAHYKNVDKNVVIKTALISGTNNISAIQFQDPWLVDYADGNYYGEKRNQGMSAPFKQRQSPFSPDYTTGYNGDVYQGVFLGQGYDQNTNTWNPPYYSVKVDNIIQTTEHSEQVYWIFKNWQGNLVQYQNPNAAVTPLVFTATGAVAEARFKGRLASSLSTATGPNGSRVVVRSRNQFSRQEPPHDPVYYLHMAYADGGETWYMKTEQDAINWSGEVQVSDGNGGNHNPSITTLNNVAYISWAKKSGSTWNILYRTYNNGTNVWGATETIATFTSSSTPTPQIALTENPLRVMVVSNKNSNVTGWLHKNGSWQSAGINISGDLPSLCANQPAQAAPFDDIVLAYRYNDNIYLRNWDTSNES